MLVRLKVSTFADTAGSGVSAAVLVLYFVQARHYETDQVGFLLSLTGIVGAVASVMSARALGRARPVQALIVVYLVQAALAALLAKLPRLELAEEKVRFRKDNPTVRAPVALAVRAGRG